VRLILLAYLNSITTGQTVAGAHTVISVECLSILVSRRTHIFRRLDVNLANTMNSGRYFELQFATHLPNPCVVCVCVCVCVCVSVTGMYL